MAASEAFPLNLGSCFKLLGVYFSEDLSWASHCDPIIKRANRRLYALRVLKNCGLPMQDLLAVYCSLIRSILEYASIVFAIFRTKWMQKPKIFGIKNVMDRGIRKKNHILVIS